MKRVVLGLGTNLGDRRENLRAALAALSHLPKTEVENVSSVWQTAPFDVPDEQQDYWNICVLLKTELSPSAVLGACLGIEAAMGRVRTVHGLRCFAVRGLHTARKGAQCAAPRHFGARVRAVPAFGAVSGKECVRLRFCGRTGL